ncbi:hypothetical protein DFA_00107 [Cavenderia fasciculata]|uniref:Uncharacterized protein n=1 Tax=Cavenderia fasciculata TaxID=261658 RepID=F4PXL9_CACFS|nr:uncharacterized protein DFA_00107 [Cavenderia fasciculata]EGG19529.1 hypothetical protein DFA_00107 [Cavenderia fasciculata]|eukprot:XP_004357823.1 hypothetical protein DFA_00107 [Cavenderia fasciculata]
MEIISNNSKLKIQLFNLIFLMEFYYLMERLIKDYQKKFWRIHFINPILDVQYSKTTNELIGGYKMEFSLVYNNNEFNIPTSMVGVVQNRNNGERWLLLDPGLFNHLPIHLYQNYSHWINLATNEIEFRPPTFQQYKDGGGSDTAKFIGTKNGEIKWKSTGEPLLYFGEHYEILRKLICQLFPLESKSSIHIFQKEASKLYRIHLNQYGLDFIVDCQNQQINSVQYSGYRLSQNNTLELWLMNKDCIGFNNAKSSSTTLNHPAYFIYDIDQELKMIKSSDLTAHLHLCYSHIVTSSLFRDPFTGLRGMELGIMLLKKFNNNMPLHQSQLDILSNISNISPKRVTGDTIKQQQKVVILYPLLSLLAMDNAKNKTSIFSKLVSFPETLTLYDLYFSLYQQEKGDVVVSFMKSKLEKTFIKDVQDENVLATLAPSHSKQASLVSKYAIDKMQDQIIYSNMVEEEQEREFEMEVEVEMERQFPKKVTRYSETIDQGWQKILNGSTSVRGCPIFLSKIYSKIPVSGNVYNYKRNVFHHCGPPKTLSIPLPIKTEYWPIILMNMSNKSIMFW